MGPCRDSPALGLPGAALGAFCTLQNLADVDPSASESINPHAVPAIARSLTASAASDPFGSWVFGPLPFTMQDVSVLASLRHGMRILGVISLRLSFLRSRYASIRHARYVSRALGRITSRRVSRQPVSVHRCASIGLSRRDRGGMAAKAWGKRAVRSFPSRL
jgi:hypothetical protein